MAQIIQCVPNFSEGRRADVMAAIVAAVRDTPGVRLADWSADHDHNRLVVTFVGTPGPVRAAALAAAGVAVDQIDLTAHQGVHPRLGALDVLPFVPVRDVTLGECAALAVEVGRELAERHALPVFLYEAGSPAPDNGAAGGGGRVRSLPSVRREAFRTLAPDFGPIGPHPTAGAAVVGARGPLIAYNVNLATGDLQIARRIAREMRDGGGAGFHGVRALGLTLESRGLTQVSMNITRPESTSVLAIFTYVTRRARELGAKTMESEVIGALPGFSAFAILGDVLRASGLKPSQVLWENWPDPGEDTLGRESSRDL